MATTCTYELSAREVYEIRWALLVLRSRDYIETPHMSVEEIVELEVKLRWRPEGSESSVKHPREYGRCEETVKTRVCWGCAGNGVILLGKLGSIPCGLCKGSGVLLG
jgi:hypothetical protein